MINLFTKEKDVGVGRKSKTNLMCGTLTQLLYMCYKNIITSYLCPYSSRDIY